MKLQVLGKQDLDLDLDLCTQRFFSSNIFTICKLEYICDFTFRLTGLNKFDSFKLQQLQNVSFVQMFIAMLLDFFSEAFVLKACKYISSFFSPGSVQTPLCIQ